MHDWKRFCYRYSPLVLLLGWPALGTAQPAIDGVWMLDGSYGEGGFNWSEIAMTEEGQRRYDAFDILSDDPSLECIPSGPGRIWDNPGSPIEIEQFDDRVEFRFEMFDLRRTVPLNQQGHPLEAAPSTHNLDGRPISTMGHSIGWYEGDELLVETLAYEPGFITTMRRYIPQSAAMRSIERFYREGERLVLEITYADSITLTEPLTFEYRFRRSDFDVVVYGCTPENAGYGDR